MWATKLVAGVAVCLVTLLGAGAGAGATAATPSNDEEAEVQAAPTPVVPTIVPIAPARSSPPPGTASPMRPEAGAHYQRGLDLYAAQDYGAAVEELQKGFAIDPRREFLFAQAQALRLAGDCEKAIILYQAFIASDPTPVQMQAARLGLDRCGPERARSASSDWGRSKPTGPMTSTGSRVPPSTSPAASPALPPSASPQPIGLAPPASPPEAHVWWHDPWAGVSLGVGVVALGVAAGFEIASSHARSQAQSSSTGTEFQFGSLWSTAQQRREIAVSALLGGVALLAVGSARLLFLARRASALGRSEPAAPSNTLLSLSLRTGGAGLTWRSDF